MCGISGIVNLTGQNVDPIQLENMLKQIKHRGPDDEGIFIKDNVGLGHVRLSIIDLTSAGHQPMFSNDERYSIVFNGEIYNYLELKHELKDSYTFKSNTDTEVLLAAYIAWGDSFLSRLNGDFSFAIYDTIEKKLFAARDRFGIKPFYYYVNSETFIFASEIKALLPSIKNIIPNQKSIFEYLVYNRTDQSQETFFDSILKLKHGHCATIVNGKVTIKQWYNLSENINSPTLLTAEEYREEFNKSIGLRLRSDVPIGVCLSGGIDSSAITSILYHDFKLKELKTFSAVYEKGNSSDESYFIDRFKPTIKNMFYVTPTAELFYNEFTDFIAFHTEPIPSVTPFAQNKVMQLAKGNVTVTLDGQGADEMLGGYTYFYGSYFKELFKSFEWGTLIKEAFQYYKKNPSKDAFKYFIYYMLSVKMKNFALQKASKDLNHDFYSSYSKESKISADFYNPKSLHDFLLQHFEYKLEHLLKWGDLNSMNSSIESRIPFLDHNLVEKTLSLPSNLILKNGSSKYILRESVKNVLPKEIYERHDKKGFTTPGDEWFRTPIFQNYVNDLLDSSSFKNRGYFNANICKQKYQKHLKGEANFSKDIWKWINLEIWFRKFIDK